MHSEQFLVGTEQIRVSRLSLRLLVSFPGSTDGCRDISSLRLTRSLPGSHLSHLHVREVRVQASGHLQACLPCFTAEPQEGVKLPGAQVEPLGVLVGAKQTRGLIS